MWRRRMCFVRLQHRMLVVLVLVNHLVVMVGYPLPHPRRPKPEGDLPYPCYGRACGCRSAEECWSGDCCCFTLQQKIAWAYARGFTPPPHALDRVRLQVGTSEACPDCCSQRLAGPSCCSAGSDWPTTQPIAADTADFEWGWVIGIRAKTCRGEELPAWTFLSLLAIPTHIHAWLVESDSGEAIRLDSVKCEGLRPQPSTPPPRQ